VLLQAHGDELDEFVSTPHEILIKVVENTFPLFAKSMDSYELQTLEYKVRKRSLPMYQTGRQLAHTQKQSLHSGYSRIRILVLFCAQRLTIMYSGNMHSAIGQVGISCGILFRLLLQDIRVVLNK
jgi:hypothetical protein